MRNIKGWVLAVASIVFPAASYADIVSFDLTNPTSSSGQNGYYADSYSYNAGGINLTVTGFSLGGDRHRPFGEYEWADVGLYRGGLGVESGRGTSHTVDNRHGDFDFLLFSFDQEVELNSISLGYISGRHGDSDVSYGSMDNNSYTWTGSIYDAKLGENIANPASISEDTWVIGAFHPFFSEVKDWCWDGFKVSGISVNVNAVPLPAAFWFFASGLGMLAYLRRRRQATIAA